MRAMVETKKTKVLVVDDEVHIREFLHEILTEDGHEVLTAASGEAALPVAKQEQPDLILLDIKMPGLSGLEVCRRLRADAATQRIRIIILTAFDTRDQLEESIVAGADDFLGKPVQLAELRLRVQSMLNVRDMEDEVERLEAYIKSMDHLRGHPIR